MPVCFADAITLYRALLTTGTTVKLFYVENENIVDAYRNIPANIPSVPGTMRIHQVVTNRKRPLDLQGCKQGCVLH